MVKFSPSVCVAVVASLTREVAVRSFAYQLMEQTSAVIHGHDKTLNQQCVHARSGSPPDDNHLTSYCSFVKEHSWRKHLTSLPQRRLGGFHI